MLKKLSKFEYNTMRNSLPCGRLLHFTPIECTEQYFFENYTFACHGCGKFLAAAMLLHQQADGRIMHL